MQQNKDLALELQDVLNRLKRSKLFDHSLHLRSAEKQVLFKIAKLNSGAAVTPSEIAATLNVSMSAVTHQINSLENGGFIIRVHSKDDRRVVAIELSAKGRKEVQKLQKEFSRKIQLLADYLGEKDVRDLVRVIGKILDLAQARKEGNV